MSLRIYLLTSRLALLPARVFALAALAGVALLALPACNRSGAERKSPHETVKGQFASVDYGRPAKRGRQIFGGLIPYGEVWRTGADEATEITFLKDTRFGGQSVKAGRYALFTIPGQQRWTVILNSKLGQWGAYNYSEKDDAARVQVPVEAATPPVEMFTIALADSAAGGSLTLSWDTQRLRVPLEYAQ